MFSKQFFEEFLLLFVFMETHFLNLLPGQASLLFNLTSTFLSGFVDFSAIFLKKFSNYFPLLFCLTFILNLRRVLKLTYLLGFICVR